MKRHVKSITMLNVLEATTDGYELFTFIANDVKSFGLTHKQYYDRLSKLIKMHLVKRKGEKYMLTTFGRVIYQLHLTLIKAVNDRLLLNWFESQISSELQLKPIPDLVLTNS